MPGIQPQTVQLTALERPHCLKCLNRTNLARIQAGPKGFDIRYFRCAKCDFSIATTVATDPMHSETMGWLAGELKPPR